MAGQGGGGGRGGGGTGMGQTLNSGLPILPLAQAPRLPRLRSVNSWVSKTSEALDHYPVTFHIEDHTIQPSLPAVA